MSGRPIQSHPMVNQGGSRPRAEAAIIETATLVLAEHPHASMGEIASAVGIGRATLYRHFPTRERLMEAVSLAAATELAARVENAGLELAPVDEGLHRLFRAVLIVANHYRILVGARSAPDSPAGKVVAREVEEPVAALFDRGVGDGTLRADLGTEVLVGLFGGLVVGAIDTGLANAIGVEQMAALMGSAFLDGIRGQT